MNDTLVGFLEDEDIDKWKILLSAMGKTTFSLNDIERKIESDKRFENINTLKMFDALYNSSGIGNLNPRTQYVTYKYRNLYSTFDPNQLIIIHRGLQKALNLRHERGTFETF